MKEVSIIGGGISGLTCGLHLAEAGYKVTVLEKEAIIGGLARSFFIEFLKKEENLSKPLNVK